MNPFPFVKREQPGSGRVLRALKGSLLSGALLCSVVGLNISCGGSSGSSSTPPPTPTPPVAGSVIGTVKDSISGSPVSGATVTDGTSTTTTAADGTYTLSVQPSDRKQITVKASNYGETHRITAVVGGKSNQVDVVLLPAAVTLIPDLSSDTTVVVPNSPAQVVLPASGLVTASGGAPAYPVKASLTPIDPSNNPQLMPGDYTTNTGESLMSYGALDATFTDSTGLPLNLAPGKTATIRIPLASFHWGGAPPSTVPAYYFETTSGRWVKEGTLTLEGTGVDQYYEGTVGHFTTWNADNTGVTTCITGKVVRTDHSAVYGAVVTATGVSYLGTSSITSAIDGTFQLPVMANQTFTVTATQGFLSTGTPILTVTNPSLTLNGSFNGASFWTVGTGWAIATGFATHTAGSGNTVALSESQLSIASNTNYSVTFTISGQTKGSVTASLGGTNGTSRSSNNTFIETITSGSTNALLAFTPSSDFDGSLSNVSVVPTPAASGCQSVGELIIDGNLYLTGTIRDMSPSAPYTFSGYTTSTVSPGTNLMRTNNGDPTAVIDQGIFPTTNNWSGLGSGGWALHSGGGSADRTSGSSSAAITLTLQRNSKNILVNGNTCTLTYTVACTAGSVTASVGGTAGTARSASGTYTDVITCGSSNTVVFTANSAFRGSISSVTLTDGHPAPMVINANTPFPLYTGDAALGSFDGPWWNPDFEMSDAYPSSHGIVNVQLGSNNKPVFSGLAWASSGVHSANSFNAWWTDFPSPHGTNDAQPYQGPLTIPLTEQLPETSPPTYVYDNSVQFPIDGMYQGNYIYNNTGADSGARGTAATCPDDTPANSKNHNFSYTYELHLQFTYRLGQVFTFIGDDDVYVFINKLLVIDLGGVHGSQTGSVTLNATTKATDGTTPLNLVDGQVYQFDFFYCERHTTQSHMKITTSIPLNDSLIPN